ncbi:MAG: hypothetical protein WC828_08950 [Thermoleophilia bacterium]|jgi:phosphoglycerol transferase
MTNSKSKTNNKEPGNTQSSFSIYSIAKTAAIYAVAIAACLLATVWVLKLWRADLSVPFVYQGDAFVNSVWIKGIIDNGWYLFNNYVGAPAGLAMADFPTSDNLHFFLIKVISLFAGDYAVTMNIFFLATFPLTTVSSLFVFRKLNISYPVAIFGSLLYTFLPYHLFRGESHLFLAAIYVIPLTSLLILRIGSETPPFIKDKKNSGERYDLLSPRAAGYVLVAILTASAGIYYAFFACFFLIAAGAYAASRRRSLKRLYVALIAFGIVIVALFINLSPSFIYEYEHGKNEEATRRYEIESEIYGMTIGQLILPITDHRVGFMADLKSKQLQEGGYKGVRAYFINENDLSSLGLIGSIGLLFSLVWLIFARRRDIDKEKLDLPMLDTLGVLNILGILLATVGGFSLLFAMLVSPSIRSYNRISPYIAYFSILVVLVILEGLRRRYIKSRLQSLAFYTILLSVLIAGVLDQTTNGMVPIYSVNATVYASDESFIKTIENEMPDQAQIFQLPYMPFPESGAVNHMASYEPFRAYLHSSRLHWSYGVIKGREGDLWQRDVSVEPTSQMIQDLVAAGFTGIYVNRYGYTDYAVGIQRELETALNEKPLANADNTLLFFNMTDYAKKTNH